VAKGEKGKLSRKQRRRRVRASKSNRRIVVTLRRDKGEESNKRGYVEGNIG
jgi:hypothetical protein